MNTQTKRQNESERGRETESKREKNWNRLGYMLEIRGGTAEGVGCEAGNNNPSALIRPS
jgi:hypothetical protein